MTKQEFTNEYKHLINEILLNQLDIIASDENKPIDKAMLFVLINLFKNSTLDQELFNILYETCKEYNLLLKNCDYIEFVNFYIDDKGNLTNE